LVVGSVGDGRALLAEAERLHPDVIVLDITMPRLDGIQAAAQLLRSSHPARLVFLTVQKTPTSPEPRWIRVRSVISLRNGSLPTSCLPSGQRSPTAVSSHRQFPWKKTDDHLGFRCGMTVQNSRFTVSNYQEALGWARSVLDRVAATKVRRLKVRLSIAGANISRE
jgi:CheY-like chemotaxis protein